MTAPKNPDQVALEGTVVEPDALIPVASVPRPPKPKREPMVTGPVYAGTCATIRALCAEGKEHAGKEPIIDKARWAGTIAQARSLAASIDRASGHFGPASQANGVPLAAMHEKLDALLARMNPDATDAVDPIVALTEELRRQEEAQRAAALEGGPS